MDNKSTITFDADEIPSLPGVAIRLLEIFDDPDVSIEEFAEVISADPALTVKIIDYCNSPIIGRQQVTTNLQQAVLVLGLRAVKLIALSFSLIQTKSNDSDSFDYRSFWNQSLATALVSKLLFDKKSGNGDDAFLVGLMLNIGEIVTARSSRKRKQLNGQASNGSEEDEKTNGVEATDQHKLGGSLLEHWNFPSTVCEVVSSFGSESAERTELVVTLSVAEQVALMLFQEEFSIDDVDKLQESAKLLLELDDEQFDEFFEKTMSEWSEFAKLLSLETGGINSLKELENRAKKSLTKLSLGLEMENQMIHAENENLKSKVNTDELTGLKNRRAYNSEVAAEVERARRMESSLCLMVIDIDFFKKVNDTYGHAGGDEVILGVVACLNKSVRSYDFVYRFGGEEFAIMMTNCALEEAKTMANRILNAVAQNKIAYGKHEIKVTVSIGVACLKPECLETVDQLFVLADLSLYKAKSEGRNCYRLCSEYTPMSMPSPTNERD